MVASFSASKTFRDGDLFLTNQRLIWKKANSLKAGFKGGLIMGLISAVGQNTYSIPLNTCRGTSENLAHTLAKASYLHKAGLNGIPQTNANQQEYQNVVGKVGVEFCHQGQQNGFN